MVTDFLKEERETKRQIEEERERRIAKLAHDMRLVLGTDSGLNVVRHILDLCGTFGRQMTGNSYTFYNEGKADVGKEILMEIAAVNPTAYGKISVLGLREAYVDKNKGGKG